jgi:DNA excision repair protein ERCC-8
MSPSPGDAWYPTRASLANRELGLARPRAFLADVASRRRDALSLAGDKTLSMPWASGVNALRVDETEHRYLLAGATDATIAVYDTAQPSRVDPRTGVATHDPIRRVRRGAGDGAARSPGHAFAVSSVDWYPVDTGMFFTASFDQTVAGWDANACARVVDFAFEDKVYCIATAKGGRGGGIGGGGGETAPRTTLFAWCTPFLKDFSRRHSSPALPFQRLTVRRSTDRSLHPRRRRDARARRVRARPSRREALRPGQRERHARAERAPRRGVGAGVGARERVRARQRRRRGRRSAMGRAKGGRVYGFGSRQRGGHCGGGRVGERDDVPGGSPADARGARAADATGGG